MSKTEVAIYLKLYNQLKPGLGAARASLDSFANGVTSRMRAMAQNVAAITGGILAGATAAMIAKGGLGFNATLESLESSFAVLYDSAERAREKMVELVKFAATTPFELPEVANAARILENFGLAGDRYLRLVGDSASGVKRPLEEVAMALGRIQSGAYGEAFMRLAEMGVATRKMLEGEGLVFNRSGSYTGSADAAVAAVTAIMERRFGGMMVVQSKQWEGLMSTLKDSWNIMTGKLTEPLFNTLKPVLSEIIGALDKFGKSTTIQKWGKEIGETAGDALIRIKDTAGWLIEHRAALNQASLAVQGVAIAIGGVVLVTKAWTAATVVLNTVTKANPWVLLASVLISVGAAIWRLVEGTGGWAHAWGKVRDAAKDAVGWIERWIQKDIARANMQQGMWEGNTRSAEHYREALKDIGKTAVAMPGMGAYETTKYLADVGLVAPQFKVVSNALQQQATDAAALAKQYEAAAASARSLAEATRELKDYDAAALGAGESAYSTMFDAYGRPVHPDFGPQDAGTVFSSPEEARAVAEALDWSFQNLDKIKTVLPQVRSAGDTAMSALRDGAVNAANALANSFAAAIFATKERLIDLAAIGRGIFGMLISFGVRFGLAQLIPGLGTALGIAGSSGASAASGAGTSVINWGGGIGGMPESAGGNGFALAGKSTGGRTITINDQRTINLNGGDSIFVDRLLLRRAAAILQEEQEKIKRSFLDPAVAT